jgi:hypothetical protein
MLAWVLIGGAVASLFVVAWLIKNAPEGYQDENGFHYGRMDRK